MPEELPQGASRVREGLGTLQLLITVLAAALSLATAALGGYLSWQQGKIKTQQDEILKAQEEIKRKQSELALHTQTTAQTEKFVQIAESYLDKLTIEKRQKEAIQIDLFDAIALATVSAEGKSDRAKLEHMPLSIALATQNVDALGLIGIADDRRETWLGLAKVSGDPNVRITAMTALARTSGRDPMDHLLKIYELSDWLSNGDTLNKAIEQLSVVIAVMKGDSNPDKFRDAKPLVPLVNRLEELRTAFASQAAALGGDKQKTEIALQNESRVKEALKLLRSSPGPAAAVAEVGPSTRECIDLWLQSDPAHARELKDWWRTKGFRGDAVALVREDGNSDRRDVFINEKHVACGEIVPPPPPPPPPPAPPDSRLASLLTDLKSDNADKRREVRDALANSVDPEVTDQLLAALLVEGSNYRVRIGVASSLYSTRRQIVVTDAGKAAALVALIGDDDELVRKYSSETLMKLTDPPTVALVHGELRKLVDPSRPASPNAMYNAVVVLGTWLRVLPASLQGEKAGIEGDLRELQKKLKGDRNWEHTAKLIDEMLRLKEAGRQAAAAVAQTGQ